MDPEIPKNEKYERSHPDFVKLGGVYRDNLSEPLHQRWIHLDVEVAFQDVHACWRSSLRKRHSHPGIGRTSVVVPYQETTHPADGVPDSECGRAQIGHLAEGQRSPLDLVDDEDECSSKSAVPYHSASGEDGRYRIGQKRVVVQEHIVGLRPYHPSQHRHEHQVPRSLRIVAGSLHL